MYEPHPNFRLPKTKTTRIWRYMDFTKYVSLLESASLFFSRADQLGDPHETSVPFAMLNKMRSEFRSLESVDTEAAKERRIVLSHNAEMFVNMSNQMSLTCYVNCWNMNKIELDAMWRVYLGNREGVAIQSTVSRFLKSLEATPELVYLGKVSYPDSNKADLHNKDGTLNAFSCVLMKRPYFKADKEFRAVHYISLNENEAPRDGVQIKVDLNTLIRRIVVSPQSPPWFGDLVESVSIKYGVKAEKAASAMNESPVRRVILPPITKDQTTPNE
jgi:hypothetical protein